MTPTSKRELWDRYRRFLCVCPLTGLQLDVSRMKFRESLFDEIGPAAAKAFDEMDALEAGAIANPDENRMVGHYWLRDAARAPDPAIAAAIREATDCIGTFVNDVHAAKVRPQRGGRFATALVIGIGGSVLGPQLVADALESRHDRMRIRFIDNTDPDGIDRELDRMGGSLAETLAVVVSKSGTTVETRNGMLEVAHAYKAEGLDFGRHAVAVTGEGSVLHQAAQRENWLEVFPMWDWVGGRTSVTSAVGLLPAALQGVDANAFLAGARDMDVATRRHDTLNNPAAMMALMWHHASGGRGLKDLVILPYKDRLALLARYLQQLVMESLGKETDRDGRVVHQGLTVYGNKGSTDQHAYVQQLRDGIHNFFVTFVEVLRDREGSTIEVEPGVTTGDYLHGFLMGTREALFEEGRESMTLTLPEVNARTLGALIALFERTVGLYASLINVNAYHQPGVEAGKKAGGRVIALQRRVAEAVQGRSADATTAEEIAARLGVPEEVETIHRILERQGISKSALD